MSFVHLHVHSAFSMLESCARIEALTAAAAAEQMPALALTDKGNMHAAVPFYESCLKHGIKPIIGVEMPFIWEEERYSLVLLAASTDGYHELLQLLTEVQLHQQEQALELRHLKELNEVFIIQPMNGGPLQTLLLHEQRERAALWETTLKDEAGVQIWTEVQFHQTAWERSVLLSLRDWEKQFPQRFTASVHLHAASKEDTEVLPVLEAVRSGGQVELAPEEMSYWHFMREEEVRSLLPGWEEAVDEAGRIAAACSWELPLGQQLLPSYPGDVPSAQLLEQWCRDGLKRRYETVTAEVEARLKRELDVILSMQFEDYFLIVADFMAYAAAHGLKTGPGRGSAAGSLAAYVLGITEVDPVKYDLLFERFLNPGRVSMPDIDIDFADQDREQVIRYVAETYGHDRVAQIITFGTFAAKAALRDTGRALGFDQRRLDELAKMIPSRPGITLRQALEENSALQEAAEEEAAGQLLQMSERIEGLPRHASIHAAGIVVSDQPLAAEVPLQRGQEGLSLTGFPMGDVEKLGLLKMDFLGLRNLTLIQQMEKDTGTAAPSEPEPDPAVFALLSEGRTAGVFQLESAGMQRVLKKLKPADFEDIVAVNALYRPGPMEFIPEYIDRRHGKKPVSYIHPALEPILKQTYGILIYQEQIMQTAVTMAGFSLSEADLLRRAVSKKQPDELEEMEQRFKEGGRSNGFGTEETAEVFSQILRFANYGFNRSHAVAYSLISYQLAYFKARFPEAFYAALLDFAVHDDERRSMFMQEAAAAGIQILGPCVQRGGARFRSGEDGLRTGLTAVKQVGGGLARAVEAERANGPYQDLFDFAARLPRQQINTRSLEALILSGALDVFGVHRAGLLKSIDTALEYAEQERRKKETGEALFPDEEKEARYTEAPPMSREALLKQEKAFLGFYASGHPLEEAAELLKKYDRMPVVDILASSGNVRAAGIVLQVRQVQTKKGDMMAFVELEDETGTISVTVFPEAYRRYQLQLQKGAKIFLDGKIDEYKGEKKLLLEKMVPIEELVKQSEQHDVLYLYITYSIEKTKMEALKTMLENEPGSTPVVLKYASSGNVVRLSEMWNVRVTDAFLAKLEALLGKKHAIVRQSRV
ncbi:DNA polymerase III subunit alpha [Alkalicoccus chagannorensis]|uniref:DNA polymerase III subunit alpha n=1 Tax=Alkalicoccus chagannorensis TaxID=427072 RepID=UPI00047C847F|nr:DNA polymerase III subunit alpha [Alkalicoccus chagannorensis]